MPEEEKFVRCTCGGEDSDGRMDVLHCPIHGQKPPLTVDQVLNAMGASENLADEVLQRLNAGMWDEWDCDILTGVFEHGFGAKELQIAAKAAPREANDQVTEGSAEERRDHN